MTTGLPGFLLQPTEEDSYSYGEAMDLQDENITVNAGDPYIDSIT
jgi:hypothetical protein